MLALTCAIAALVAGVIGTLSLLTVCMACAPNSSEHQIRVIKRWMLGIAIVGFSMIGAGIWLTADGRPWTGAAVGVIPAVAVFVFIVYFGVRS